MTPHHFRTVVKDIEKHSEGERPICAFMLRNGHIFTGSWATLSPASNVLVVTLSDKEAPPIYIDVHAIEAVAVGSTLPVGEWPR